MNLRELHLAARPLAFLDRHAARSPGVLELRSTPHRRLLVSDPAAIRWIFRGDARFAHPGSRTLAAVLGGRSLVWADGPRHAAYRRGLLPVLRGTRLDGYRDTIDGVVQAAVDELVVGSVVALTQWMRRISLRVMVRVVLGTGDEALATRFDSWIHRELVSGWRNLVRRRSRGRRTRSDPWLDEKLVKAASAAGGTGSTALATLLREVARDEQELRDNLVTLLFAGYETTASAAAWVLYHLHRDPALLAEVRAEAEAAADDGADAEAVPLLDAVVHEALRLNPPALWAGNRVVVDEDEFLGVRVTPGTVLTPAIHLAHRDPRQFPDPLRFDAGRFHRTTIPGDRYFPFGGGLRRCLGAELATLELRMVVVAVLRRTRLRFLDVSEAAASVRGHTSAPGHGLRVVVTACHP